LDKNIIVRFSTYDVVHEYLIDSGSIIKMLFRS
jgi:hypothetical protein